MLALPVAFALLADLLQHWQDITGLSLMAMTKDGALTTKKEVRVDGERNDGEGSVALGRRTNEFH